MNYPKLIEQNFWNVIIVRNNPYGYRLNLNHYIVRDFYWRYKKKNGIPRSYPLSDSERFDFEDIAIAWLIKNKYLFYRDDDTQTNETSKELKKGA